MVLSVDDSTHDEINIKRLLNKCEEMAKMKNDDVEESWRLGSYVCSLEKMIYQLNTQPYKPSSEIMSSYLQRLSVLKGHINIKKNPNPLEKVTVLHSIPKCSNDSSYSSSKEIEHLTEGSVNTKLREELFGGGDDGLRRRTSFKVNDEGTSEMDDLLKYHHNMQEKIADNMLSLARNIKEQSLIAGNIIRNDSLNVEKSTRLADKNITQLKVQSEKLQENTRKTCQCWIWILVVVVLVVFVNMVMLMKERKLKVIRGRKDVKFFETLKGDAESGLQELEVTRQVWLEITISKVQVGRVTIGLFGHVVPKTVDNFVKLCTSGIRGKSYRGIRFHRVIKNFLVHGGDVLYGNGTGAVSIYGEKFKDENFIVKHTGPGIVSMANKGPDTNGCQFFITTRVAPALDGRHVAFGKVIKGQRIIHQMEMTLTTTDDKPLQDLRIVNCGEYPLAKPFVIKNDWQELLRASVVPLGMSFTILGIFQLFMRKLDVALKVD